MLKTVGGLKSFDKIVGGNPDIIIERGEIILKGAKGTFRGKTLKTGLKAEDYLLNKCIYIVYKFSHQRVIVRSNLIILLV